jgi:Spy/CpxP family protein refolding chaperone
MHLSCCGLAVAAGVVTLASPRTAHAQESIAGDMWTGNALFTIDDVDLLEDVCSLSAEQTELAKELLKGVRLKNRGIRKRWERTWEDMREKAEQDGWDSVQDDYKKMAEEMVNLSKALETEFLTDLRSLLTDEQANAGWNEFERGRRRLLLRDDEAPVNADLLGMLRAAKVTKEQRDGMKEILDPYLAQLDSLIQERRPLHREVGWGPMRYFRDTEPSEETQKRHAELTQRIGQLHVRTARLVEEKLEDPPKTAFLQQRLRIEWGQHYPDFIGWSRMQDVLRIRSLTSEQRQLIRQLVRAAEEKLLPDAQGLKAKWDERVLTDFSSRDEGDDESTFAAFRKKASQTRKQLLEDVLAVLTTSQREHYENGVDGTAENEDRMLAKRRYGENNWWADELQTEDREE